MKRLLIFVFLLLLSCTAGLKYPLVLDEVAGKEEYTKANALIVFDSTNIDLNRDGTNRIRYHKLVQVFNSLGRKDFGEATFSYITLYDTIRVLYAAVITPDKKVIKVDKENITDMPMPAWEGSKFYIPNLRFVKIIFPELVDGGAVEYVVESINHNPPFDSTFDWWELFEETEPIREKVLRLSLPLDMSLKYRVENGEVLHRDTTVDGRKIHIWQKQDVAKVILEPSMPPLNTVLTKLLFTCTDSWRDYSRWYYRLSEPKLVPDSALNNKVNELIQNARTFDDTVRALYEYVNKKIRYVETRLIGKKGGYEPAPVSFTFRNKYGVCRDKAALLVSMLRTAGIKQTYMVLTNPFIDKMADDMPVASQFNHAIVAIKTDTGVIYLDPTAEGSVEYLLPFEDGKAVLIATEDGEGITQTPIRPPDINLADITSSGKLTLDKTLHQTLLIKGKGLIDLQLRRMAQMMTSEQLKQIFLQGLKGEHPQARIDSFKMSDPKDFTKRMELKIYMTIPDYVLKIGKEWHLASGRTASFSFGSQGMWNLEERKYPLFMGISLTTRVRSELNYPKNLKLRSLPDEFNYDSDAFSVHISYAGKKNLITNETEIVFKQAQYPPDKYLQVKDCMKRLEEYQGKEIILVEK